MSLVKMQRVLSALQNKKNFTTTTARLLVLLVTMGVTEVMIELERLSIRKILENHCYISSSAVFVLLWSTLTTF